MCVIDVYQRYTVEIENVEKSIFDFAVYLESCKSANPQRCRPISRPYPECRAECFLDGDDNFRGRFRLALRGHGDVMALEMSLNRSANGDGNYGPSHFRFSMTPKNAAEPQVATEMFSIPTDVCEGVVQVDAYRPDGRPEIESGGCTVYVMLCLLPYAFIGAIFIIAVHQRRRRWNAEGLPGGNSAIRA